MYHHIEDAEAGEVKKILAALTRIERKADTSMATALELLTEARAAQVATGESLTNVAGDIDRLQAMIAALPTDTAAVEALAGEIRDAATAMATAAAAVAADVPEDAPEEPPAEPV